MNTRQALRSAMDMSLFVLNTYIGDLSDTELMERPHPACNHVAWQLGHLISSEVSLLESICPGRAAALPAGFAEQHAKETCRENNPAEFQGKAAYQELFTKVRAATLAALEETSDEALDAPAPEWIREHFPAVGHMFMLIATHPLMHAGQFVVVRRALGKPVLI